MSVVRRRYVWICRHPKGKVRVYAKQEALEAELPGRMRFKKKALNPTGTVWQYGEVNKFVAERLPIRDSSNLPI